MNLVSHLFLHFLMSFLAAFLAWKWSGKFSTAFLSAIISGFLVDLDHLLDYFLAFGWSFNFDYFISGYQFLKSDKLYIFFHAWEYVLLFFTMIFLSKRIFFKTLFLALSLSLFFHLCTDIVLNKIPVSSYSLIRRYEQDFLLKNLVSSRHWENHLREKREIGWLNDINL